MSVQVVVAESGIPVHQAIAQLRQAYDDDTQRVIEVGVFDRAKPYDVAIGIRDGYSGHDNARFADRDTVGDNVRQYIQIGSCSTSPTSFVTVLEQAAQQLQEPTLHFNLDPYDWPTIYVEGTPQPPKDAAAILNEHTRLSNEMNVLTTVCVNHLRFVPCRSEDGDHRYSTNAEDIARVTDHQRG